MPQMPTTDLFGEEVQPRINTATSIVFVLDRSGSMSTIWDATVEGFKEFLNGQRAVDGDVYLTLVVFDNVVDTVYIARPIESVDDDILANYPPRGMTALYDAVDRALREHRDRIEQLPVQERPATHIAVVATDGGENASTGTTKEAVTRLISEFEDSGYQIVFIGASSEGWASGVNLGFDQSSTIAYQATPTSAGATWGALGASVSNYRMARGSAADNGDVSTFYTTTLNLTATYVDDEGNTYTVDEDTVEEP